LSAARCDRPAGVSVSAAATDSRFPQFIAQATGKQEDSAMDAPVVKPSQSDRLCSIQLADQMEAA
jgi:hypothetical protein